MKLIFAISIVALSFFGTACRSSVGEMILVPMPQEAIFTKGCFETDSARFVQRAGDGYVACRIDPSAPEIRPEGYRLKVTRRGIDLTALDSAGLFYGRQTLCQLATAQGIPCVEIIDNPRFGYRGIHLDVSRHFFPVFPPHRKFTLQKANTSGIISVCGSLLEPARTKEAFRRS